MDKADRAQGTGAEPERKPSMSMSKAILLISACYLAVKIPMCAFCYFSRLSFWSQPSAPALMYVCMASAWVLPVVVVAGTLVWQWKAPSFRWPSVVAFVVLMAGLAFSETVLWWYLTFLRAWTL